MYTNCIVGYAFLLFCDLKSKSYYYFFNLKCRYLHDLKIPKPSKYVAIVKLAGILSTHRVVWYSPFKKIFNCVFPNIYITLK